MFCCKRCRTQGPHAQYVCMDMLGVGTQWLLDELGSVFILLLVEVLSDQLSSYALPMNCSKESFTFLTSSLAIKWITYIISEGSSLSQRHHHLLYNLSALLYGRLATFMPRLESQVRTSGGTINQFTRNPYTLLVRDSHFQPNFNESYEFMSLGDDGHFSYG